MLWLWILLGIIVFAGIALLAISYICYRITFYSPKRKLLGPDEYDIPEGKIYEAWREPMIQWAKEVRAMPYEEFSITSFDGLKLYAKFYEYAPGAPIELMFHGYRGSAERDLNGGVQRCRKLGRSTFLVDQRCSGKSDGSTITFGIHEHRDCLAWVDFMVKHFGPDVKIILTGISMGASTVLLAAGEPLPKNVIGVLADCGFSEAKSIICAVIKQMGLPVKLSYPFVKLGAKLFGHFDLEETSALEAMSKCTVPVIFFHGENDDYVPCYMSKQMFDVCQSKKRLVTVPGAGHGLSYPVAPGDYLDALRSFFGEEASYQG